MSLVIKYIILKSSYSYIYIHNHGPYLKLGCFIGSSANVNITSVNLDLRFPDVRDNLNVQSVESSNMYFSFCILCNYYIYIYIYIYIDCYLKILSFIYHIHMINMCIYIYYWVTCLVDFKLSKNNCPAS